MEERDGVIQPLEKLQKTRRYTRAKITRLCNAIEFGTDPLDENQRILNLEKLKSLRSAVQNENAAILDLSIDGGISEEEMQNCIADEEYYDEKIMKNIGILQNMNDNISSTRNESSNNETRINSMKLPKIQLPTFSNKTDENLRKFLRSFESIVMKHPLSSFEQFIYLKGQLSGGPKTLIDSLNTENQRYETAKQLLEDAFDCEYKAKKNTIKRLANLKMSYNTDPYAYIGEMKAIVSDFEELKIGIEDILHYFIWQGINDKFQSSVIAICNKTEPTLPEITHKIFEATLRYKRDSNTDNFCSRKSSNQSRSEQNGKKKNLLSVMKAWQ